MLDEITQIFLETEFYKIPTVAQYVQEVAQSEGYWEFQFTQATLEDLYDQRNFDVETATIYYQDDLCAIHAGFKVWYFYLEGEHVGVLKIDNTITYQTFLERIEAMKHTEEPRYFYHLEKAMREHIKPKTYEVEIVPTLLLK